MNGQEMDDTDDYLDAVGVYGLGEEEEVAGIAASLAYMSIAQTQGGGG